MQENAISESAAISDEIRKRILSCKTFHELRDKELCKRDYLQLTNTHSLQLNNKLEKYLR